MNYHFNLQAYLKSLVHSEPNPEIFNKTDSKPYWTVTYEYMGKEKTVAYRNLHKAIMASLINAGYIRQYGEYSVSAMERVNLSAISQS